MTHNLKNTIESTGNDVVTDTDTTYEDTDTSNGTEDEGVDSDIPEEFICPLTLEIYSDPLMSRRGLNFERKAIIEWLDRGHETCPLTRDPLGYGRLVPNARLRLEVEEWKRKHGYEIKPRDVEAEMKNRQFLWKSQHFVCMTLIDTDTTTDTDRLPALTASTSTSGGNNNHSQRQIIRSLRRRRDDARSTGLSPATQRPRFVTLVGEALNTVRRAPIVNS